MRLLCLVGFWGALACSTLPALSVCAEFPRPNIIHIFADDLGWGSVGFNGQTQIATPNLDALAAAGMRFTNSYACPVCAASRATLYTGFHTGHTNVDGNSELTQGFRANEVMTAQVLAPAGYTSAVFGKWGFGADGVRTIGGNDPLPSITTPDSLPTNHGFDEFYGLLNHGAAQDYFYQWMWRSDSSPQGVSAIPNNGGPGGSAQYTHDLFAAQSEQFVAAHAGDSDPFYMQLNYTIPHWDIDAISAAPGGYGIYANSFATTQEKAYAAMITRMDSSIGALMAKLDDPNGDGNHADSILNNTLVMFTSDNGPSTEDNSPIDYFNANGQFRGGKFELYEGGIHMPAVAYWKGTIVPGSVSDYRTDLTDFMATAADLAGVEAPVGIDGTSLAPILTGEGHLRQRDYLVFEHQGAAGADPDPRIGRWAVIRQDGMKLIRYDDESSVLYNLITDPSESSPLNLAIPANAQIAMELEADAIAEDVTRGSVQYRTWSGPNGGSLQDAQHWSSPTAPDRYWSAVVANTTASPAIAHVTADVTTLGVEIRGQSSLQVVNVHEGKTLTGLNEVRIGAYGRIDLDNGMLSSSRWVNVRAGGEVRGQGDVVGDVYNAGVVSPGRPSGDPTWPIALPPALPPSSLSTGVVTAATFNFAGVQDDVPVNATSAQSAYVEVSHGLDFGPRNVGPSVGPRWGSGGTNAGNELNLIGFNATTLAQAIANDDYITFSVDPVTGAGIVPNTVSFQLWRNGNLTTGNSAAPRNFAIFSSVKGFTASDVLAQASYTDFGDKDNHATVQHTLIANLPAIVDAIDVPTEYRLYAWNATAATGNFHVNAASLSAKFVGVPTLEFNFSGVQDGAPLTALKRQDINLALTTGLAFGAGVTPSGTNNVGNEFHVAGFSTGSTAQSAIDGSDYLSFAVTPIAGMAMIPDSVSFTLWRQGSGSAIDYAVYSSLGGFASGQQLAQTHLTTIGAANQIALGGSFASVQPTTTPVEFRLYGWNAATSVDSTHVVAASMRARFASVVGTPIDPTGSITVQGDFYHLAGGQLVIDLGGHSAGVDYDTVDVLGKVELEGDLAVSLADTGGELFAPALGDTFNILTATQGILGQFSHVTLPQLPWNLDWRVDYLANTVDLTVWSSGDFNHDGSVDAADYVVWRKNGGSQSDFSSWRSRFDLTAGSGSRASNYASASAAVPEPASASLLILVATVLTWRHPRK